MNGKLNNKVMSSIPEVPGPWLILQCQMNVIKSYLKVAIYDVDDLFSGYLGNKILLSKHAMWQTLLEFYEENNCVVNESDWPWSIRSTWRTT